VLCSLRSLIFNIEETLELFLNAVFSQIRGNENVSDWIFKKKVSKHTLVGVQELLFIMLHMHTYTLVWTLFLLLQKFLSMDVYGFQSMVIHIRTQMCKCVNVYSAVLLNKIQAWFDAACSCFCFVCRRYLPI
jgi:hypothetical protein